MYNLEKGDNMMFTYVKLTNFKSFGTVKFDFKNTKKNCKKFIARTEAGNPILYRRLNCC